MERSLRWGNKLVLEGKEKDVNLSLEGYLRLVKREDGYLMRIMNKVFAGEMFSSIVSAIIPTILLVGIAGFLLVLAFLAQALTQTLYPACIIVDEKTSFIQTVLLALGCILTSWILARVQRNMFILGAVGTKLFGHSPSSDSHGYIATKWLTLLIPILPVKSYRILGEYSNSKDKTQYSMIPLEKLDWKQVRETIQEWRALYLVSALVIIGVIAFPIWRCVR